MTKLKDVAQSVLSEVAGPRGEKPVDPMRPDPKDPDTWPSEDDIAREQLGPRGVPGEPDPARMTPQREKKTPVDHGIAPEHTK